MSIDNKSRCATLCFLQAMWYDIVGDSEQAELYIMEALTWAFPLLLITPKIMN
jgi:hypothetical protein